MSGRGVHYTSHIPIQTPGNDGHLIKRNTRHEEISVINGHKKLSSKIRVDVHEEKIQIFLRLPRAQTPTPRAKGPRHHCL